MIQVIKYKCCNKIFAACSEPDCYIDKDWLKSLKKYVERGDIPMMVDHDSGLKLEKCTCKEDKQPKLL